MSRTKESVTFHAEGFQEGRPAVNVKVYGGVYEGFPVFLKEGADEEGEPLDPTFTLDWIEETITDDQGETAWFWALENERDFLQESARSEIWGQGIEIGYQGRSGGWAVVDGIKSFEEWDAIDLGKWRKFERFCAEAVQAVPFEYVWNLYHHVFLPWREEKRKADALAYARMDRSVLV